MYENTVLEIYTNGKGEVKSANSKNSKNYFAMDHSVLGHRKSGITCLSVL